MALHGNAENKMKLFRVWMEREREEIAAKNESSSEFMRELSGW